ncbi:hypothetical protein DJ84_18250 [Halorubrum ezzemoulense]|nr:hypothetical protein DJ84_18250 [Halorubrum ezzemoulense]
MPTQVETLQEYADRMQELADEWEGEKPAIVVGEVNGTLDVSEKDGYTQHGSVGFANEIFDGNGVFELGQKVDRRFYGTVLLRREHLTEEAQEQLEHDGGES